MSLHTDPRGWSPKSTFKLIELYKKNSLLWDMKHDDYGKRKLRGRIISDIATCMNVSTKEINRKLHVLKSKIYHEISKLQKRRNKNSNDEISVSKWPYFSALKFVIPSMLNRSESLEVGIIQEILEKKCRQKEEVKTDEIENQETPKKKQKKIKGRKCFFKSLDIDEEELKRQYVSSKTWNNDERFGKWVALELQSLRSEVNKTKLKSEIRKAIYDITDLDNADISTLAHR